MTKYLAAAVLGAVLAFGCERKENDATYITPAPTIERKKIDMPPIGGGPAPSASESPTMLTVPITGATDRMAEAQCQVAMKCAEAAKTKKAPDFGRCMKDRRRSSGRGLNDATCPRGVDAAPLETCLDAIRTSSCTEITASVDTLDSCATAKLCSK